MKLTTKLTIKLFLIISLFVSATFAGDGNMPGGGFTYDPTNPDICITEDGNMPGGGFTCKESASDDEDGNMPGGGRTTLSNDSKSDNSILIFIQDYLYSLFG